MAPSCGVEMPPPGPVPAMQTSPWGLHGSRVVGTWGWGAQGGAHPSIASSTSCLIPLPSKTASCEAPASKTALNPKVASCLAALTWDGGGGSGWVGGDHSPWPPWGGGTYVDGAVAQAVHHPPVTSACLCAGQWPDPNRGVRGDTEVSPPGDPGEPRCAPGPGEAGAASDPCHVPKPTASPLPQHHPQARFLPHRGSLLLRSGAPWGNRGRRGGGCPHVRGTPRRGTRGHAVLVLSSCPHCAPAPGRGWGAASPTSPHRGSPVPPPQRFWGASPPLSHPGGHVGCSGPGHRGTGWPQSPPSPVDLRSPWAPWERCGPRALSGLPAPLALRLHSPPLHPSLGAAAAAPAWPRWEPPPAGPGPPRTTGTTARLNIDPCQPRGTAVVTRGWRGGEGAGGRRWVLHGDILSWGRGTGGGPLSAGLPNVLAPDP